MVADDWQHRNAPGESSWLPPPPASRRCEALPRLEVESDPEVWQCGDGAARWVSTDVPMPCTETTSIVLSAITVTCGLVAR